MKILALGKKYWQLRNAEREIVFLKEEPSNWNNIDIDIDRKHNTEVITHLYAYVYTYYVYINK